MIEKKSLIRINDILRIAFMYMQYWTTKLAKSHFKPRFIFMG